MQWDGVIPGKARWSEELTIQQKYLLMEINSSSRDLGYSRASNHYLQQRCGQINEATLWRWLKQLEEKGFITISIIKNKRRIYVVAPPAKVEFTPLELSSMKYDSPGKIVNKISKRFSEKYPCWEESGTQIKSILWTLANFYFDPEAYTLTLAEEKINFGLLEMLIEIIDLEKLRPLRKKLKDEFGDLENSTLYIMTAVISNHTKEIRNFREIQRRYPQDSSEQHVALYNEKLAQKEKGDQVTTQINYWKQKTEEMMKNKKSQ